MTIRSSIYIGNIWYGARWLMREFNREGDWEASYIKDHVSISITYENS